MISPRKPEELWQETKRRDGVKIVRGIDGWVIVATGGYTLATCPCCDKPLLTERAARLVADLVLPLNPPPVDRDFDHPMNAAR
jgi:hypothetical protein